MIIGLTGGSGTGKTTASGFFRDRGYLVIDCDKLAREVCLPGRPCLDELVQYFGRDIINSDGTLARRKLGSMVFGDKIKLAKLNEITHKHITAELKAVIDANKNRDILIDAPLLFEAGLGDICHKTLCILADREVRIRRIMARDSISFEDAKKRIDSQKNDEYYISNCDYAVYNSGESHMLINELSGIFGGGDGK